ncbi:MAG: Nudix family hydrolase [Gammaproteobacteria bacterium]|nr:Nudix family hydrolase [Gammaproteobacteria bacterium]MDH5651506.1 Nudix family hydrolase [Gammaproteobacteria bacterium]
MTEQVVHVAVGVIENERGEILIAKRADHLHQGGLWEFPGGKVEHGETVLTALQRELDEELALHVTATHPLIRIPYHYPDKQVLLDVHRVTDWHGDAHGREGQEIVWVNIDHLNDYTFPAANRPIIKAVQLPSIYLISGKFHDLNEFAQRLRGALQQGIRLVQLRAGDMEQQMLTELSQRAVVLCHEYDARVLINTSPEIAMRLNADGVHLNSKRLMQYTQRPVGKDVWLAASVHNEKEMQQANALDVDFVVVSPVLPTPSHPGEPNLGWAAFNALTEMAAMPVYALGGMSEATLAQARMTGGQGIAGISNWW